MYMLFFQTNEKGQVTVESSVLKQIEDLKEETGLTCCICREGYRYQPQKVSKKRSPIYQLQHVNPILIHACIVFNGINTDVLAFMVLSFEFYRFLQYTLSLRDCTWMTLRTSQGNLQDILLCLISISSMWTVIQPLSGRSLQ